MSHIFDALQRSEADRGNEEKALTLAATELLERTERESTSKWESAAAPRRAADAEIPDRRGELGRTTDPAVKDTPAPAEASRAEEIPAPFPQFKPLEISLPLQSRLVSLVQPECPAAEAFRLLAVRLRHLRSERPLKKLLITSTTPEEGKSFVSANLACILAAGTRRRVLLLDGDLRRPSVTRIFGLDEIPGVCECLESKRNIAASIYELREPGIWIMPAGNTPGNPLELMQSKRLPAMLEQLTAWFDWIVIDSPPVMPLADATIWARVADGTLLVTRPGITRKAHLQRGLDALDPKKLIGALLNSSRISGDKDYYYYRRPSSPAAPAE
jgi:capsular exopolysaccharide synthesis family protein